MVFAAAAASQCDQMARLFVQYLAVCNNENLPSTIKNLPKSCPKLKYPARNFPNIV